MANVDGAGLCIKSMATSAFWLLCLFLMSPCASANQFQVGGAAGWTVPADADAYNRWAEKMRFQIGDSLLFVYPANKDSVLQVSKDDYNNCNTKSPIARFDDGNTVIKLEKSGPHYFISGVEENCRKTEKMVVVVLAERKGSGEGTSGSQPTSPSSQGTEPSSSPPPPAAALLKIVSILGSMAALVSSFSFFA